MILNFNSIGFYNMYILLFTKLVQFLKDIFNKYSNCRFSSKFNLNLKYFLNNWYLWIALITNKAITVLKFPHKLQN